MSLEKIQEKSFKEEDVEQLVKLLNLVHTKTSGLSGEEAFTYFKGMSWVQNKLIPKMKDHILESITVHEPENNS